MANYTKTTNFAAKDALASGDPAKVATGTSVDNEFNAIATAVATKEDSANKAVPGGYAGLDGSGKLATSVIPAALPVTTLEVGHASDTTVARVSAGVLSVEGVNLITTTTGDARYLRQGLTTIPVMAGAMTATTTSGAVKATYETTTNDFTYVTLDFSLSAINNATFAIPMPKNWNDGTVTFQPIWTAASGTGDVVWQMQAVAVSNDDPLDATWGTAQVSQDTFILAGDVHIGPTSAAITVAGTPAADDLILFRIQRDPAHANDTFSALASLIGIRLFFTTNAADDT
jgi:hypothetical protein